MATSTTTRTTPNTFVSCAPESDSADVFSFAAVYRGYRACRRRKRGTAKAQVYELGLLDRLVDTAASLHDRTYAPSRSLCFVVRQPKAREIHAADFRDRVVHHVLVPRLEALFEPVFIHDLYSNRKGKGTHAAVDRLAHFMRSASDNGRRPAWFLQLDVRNFFNSIDQSLLFRFVNRRLEKAVRAGVLSSGQAWDLSWLTRVLLKQDLRRETDFRGTPGDLERVPPHKRLLAAPAGKGLPIGNLTSQFFANVYLNPLDQFVKHRLGCRRYLRYVDDLVLVDTSPERLRVWEREIASFLADRLQLELKPERRLRPVGDGADFLGYIVRPHYRLVRRRVIGNLRDRLAAFERSQVGPGGIRLPPTRRDALRDVLASYLGHFGHAHASRLVSDLLPRPRAGACSPPALRPEAALRRAAARRDEASRQAPGCGRRAAGPRARFGWLAWLFDLHGGRLRPRWEPPGVTSLRSQVGYFRRAFRPAIPLVQIGNRVALFGTDLRAALACAPWVGRWRGALAEQRPGLGAGLSWPIAHVRGLGRSLRAAGQPYGFIAEAGYLAGGMKRRVLRDLFLGEDAGAGPRQTGGSPGGQTRGVRPERARGPDSERRRAR